MNPQSLVPETSAVQTLDLDLLRTLSAVHETGTLARASRRVGRTLSAVSLQLKRLESQCGRPLFRKAGRRLELNAEGEQVLAVGRRMLSLNDQLLEGLRDDVARVDGAPRPPPGRRRALACPGAGPLHPGAPAGPAGSAGGAERGAQELLASGGLDLAVTFDPERGPPDPEEIQLPVHWLAAPGVPLAGLGHRSRWFSSSRPAPSAASRSRRWTGPGFPGAWPSPARASLDSGPRPPPVSASRCAPSSARRRGCVPARGSRGCRPSPRWHSGSRSRRRGAAGSSPISARCCSTSSSGARPTGRPQRDPVLRRPAPRSAERGPVVHVLLLDRPRRRPRPAGRSGAR